MSCPAYGERLGAMSASSLKVFLNADGLGLKKSRKD